MLTTKMLRILKSIADAPGTSLAKLAQLDGCSQLSMKLVLTKLGNAGYIEPCGKGYEVTNIGKKSIYLRKDG